ncbi:MAG: lipoyl synthase [Deltaproteobacteria bacterium]|nr:lipoyl synthase [Deltaproteobacteria bacterium]
MIAHKPAWLKVRPGGGEAYGAIKRTLGELGLHTVCEEARCPNRGECWSSGTATFLVLGDTCTRGCRFCAVHRGNPGGRVDASEPGRVARAVVTWGLRHVVITCVTRDDLPDGGAAHLAAVVAALREHAPGVTVEVLASDFGGDAQAVRTLVDAGPDVFAHNLETVDRLQARVRDPRCSVARSLEVLRLAGTIRPGMVTKSALLLGMGETAEEIRETLRALRGVGVTSLTLGQYLAPSRAHVAVAEWIAPETFEAWREEAHALGFSMVASGPLVRSSYRAGELLASGRV